MRNSPCKEKNEKKPTSKNIYSNIGYINVDKEDLCNEELKQISFSKYNHNMEGTISKSSLSETIRVNMKTLYGNRTLFSFVVNIEDKISVLVSRLLEEEAHSDSEFKWSENLQYRLISTNGLIKEVNPSMTFYEEDIKNNETLILAAPYKLYFSEVWKHKGIYVYIIL